MSEKNLLLHAKARKGGRSVMDRRSAGERVVYTIIFVLFALYALSILYPLFFLFTNSFQSRLGYLDNMTPGGNPFALPEVWHFENYLKALSEMKYPTVSGQQIGLPMMFFNSIWFVGICVFEGLFFCSCCAYVVSRYHFKGRNFIYGLAIFTMTIPIMGTMGSSFKIISDLGLYDTPLYLIVTCTGGFGFNFLILYGFFKSISWSYAESVFIDGGGHFTVFFRIMLPQARTPILTLAIMACIGTWNDYTTPLLYLPSFPTVASGLYQLDLSLSRDGNFPIQFAGLVLSILPVIIVFAIFSDTIMKNFTIGGLKG